MPFRSLYKRPDSGVGEVLHGWLANKRMTCWRSLDLRIQFGGFRPAGSHLQAPLPFAHTGFRMQGVHGRVQPFGMRWP